MRRTLTIVGLAVAAAAALGAQQPASQPAPGAGRSGRQGGVGAPQGAPNEGRGRGGALLTVERDLEYGRAGSQRLLLDLYRMVPSNAPSPVLVWIHGTEPPLSTKLATPAVAFVSAASGYAVASVEYQTASSTTPAMQLGDLKAAVRWLRAHAGSYGLDADHIGVIGFGLGGQLAALLGTTADVPSLDGDGGSAGQSSRVQAVVDLAGPTSTGGLNPVTYVTGDDAPTLILHGTADRKVSTLESQALVVALKVAGVTTTLDLQFAVGHDQGALLSPVAMQTVGAFLDQQLRVPSAGRSGQGGGGGLSSFVGTPADTYIDPIALDLGGTQYRLYPTAARGAGTFGSYRVYLPPDYQSNASRRYPVIYFLHGRSVDSKRPLVAGYVARVDAAIRAGIMPPAIIVIPQGLTTGWYVDAEDGAHPMESVIVKNLIPYIDATYRTIAARAGRAIEGHSMGGYGALHIGFKYPDLFSAVTGNSPALVDDMTDGVGSQAFWLSQAPATLAKANLDKVRAQKIRIIAGDRDSLFAVGKKLDEALTGMSVRHQFFPVVGSPHNHDQLLQYETFDTMAFYAEVFGRGK
ncbi:MAG: alpha/beta hydrolase [Acidobacteriota bacterium]